MTVADQARAFLGMALCGACIGAAYDMMALCVRGKFMTAAGDLAMGALGAICVTAVGLMMQCEAFRLYTLLGVSAGWGLYACSLGTFVRILTKRCTKCQKK
ncbi:MAG: hypothetical protein E7321_04080 [Clostridiales bacterium]|nr:hypothetical protein [Clostridiales bacterium]